MHYDPIKEKLGTLFNRWRFTRRLFYLLLDLILLRTWHIHRALNRFFAGFKRNHRLHILDAGSGFGQYAYFMAKKSPYWFVHGLDIKESEVEACTRFFQRSGIHNALFQVGDLVGFSNREAYDLILSVDVMEHIAEDEKVLQHFYESLKPGGLLLINTPSDQGGSGVQKEGDTSFIGEHVRDGYGMQEMQEKLVRAGFNKMELKYTYGKPGSLSWRLSMKWPISVLNLSKWFFVLLPLYYLLIFPLVLLLNVADVEMNHRKGTGLLVWAWKPKHT